MNIKSAGEIRERSKDPIKNAMSATISRVALECRGSNIECWTGTATSGSTMAGSGMLGKAGGAGVDALGSLTSVGESIVAGVRPIGLVYADRKPKIADADGRRLGVGRIGGLTAYKAVSHCHPYIMENPPLKSIHLRLQVFQLSRALPLTSQLRQQGQA